VAGRMIELRGVEVHNLKGIDLDLPHRQLIAICGVSGSGKTSLALDTLYAEGQRRYIESFSAYTRQFLERLEKPAAERIDGIPPAIAVTRKTSARSSRVTIGGATEIVEYLRLLYAKIGHVLCQRCGQEVRRESPQQAAELLAALPAGTRYMVAFAAGPNRGDEESTATSGDGPVKWSELGFVRGIVDNRLITLAEIEQDAAQLPAGFYVIVDRLSAGVALERLRDSLETAFQHGRGQAVAFIESSERPQLNGTPRGTTYPLQEGSHFWRVGFSRALRCEDCGEEQPTPEPRLFSFNSPLGACPTCEGLGTIIDMDLELIVPNRHKSLREGAIAPWTVSPYEEALAGLLAVADEVGIPVDTAVRNLTDAQWELIRNGVPGTEYHGLRGFFAEMEAKKNTVSVRSFLNKWRSARVCPACHGRRLRPEALTTRIADKNIAELCELKIADAREFLATVPLSDYERKVGHVMLDELRGRLSFLERVGLGYLTLDRTLSTLSGGEAQRVELTSALGSNLVGMLYVLDEPSAGLHPTDVERLLKSIRSLRDRGNTVVIVEHEETLIRTADQLIEIGPGAGERGGELIYQGPPAGIVDATGSLTGDYLSGRRGGSVSHNRRPANRGRVRLTNARGHNLKNLQAEFPLNLLCLVTGVSGAGKSSLVQETLYPALCHRMRMEADKPLAYDDVYGDGQLEDVVLVDQGPIGRSPRSNPVTYIKAFDEIRAVFAETLEARTHNFTASHFSFNVDGGRCPTCEGDGYLAIDMQFLADVYMKCSACGGTRYRKEILQAHYRGKSIADVLEMTVREAFAFFRGSIKVQAKLKQLIDVGLDYLRLGQPANTLSGGEAQRLKLAGYLAGAKRGRTLFILDEPTTGLHFADIVRLLDCFEALLQIGHSLIVIEHNVQMMLAADFIIDMGPGAAENGGQIIATGTPEEISLHSESATGRILAAALKAAEID